MLVQYDPHWPEEFERERTRIAQSLGPIALRIEHHGSTAIPGLSAKPIIDIQVSVAALEPLDAYGISLTGLGYIHLVHPDDAFAPFFYRPASWPHTHHVHVVVVGGAEERRTLAFRDYLRDHEDIARTYEQLKRRVADEIGFADAEAREAYASAKSEFVEAVTERALAAGY